MSRHLIAVAVALVAWASSARAQPAPATPPEAQPAPATPPEAQPAPATPPEAQPAPAAASTPDDEDEIGDQGISAALGLAVGGRTTPGGVRVTGRYLYQLSDDDWFDGAASFTFGSSRAACFRDRADQVICDHGLADGAGFELSANVRRLFAAQGAFRPFARVGVGIGLARFGDDDVSGFTIPLHGGGGVRVKVAPAVAVVADAELVIGFGSFNHGLGAEPQLGFAITAGAEFRLR